jgi:hypothetical protein
MEEPHDGGMAASASQQFLSMPPSARYHVRELTVYQMLEFDIDDPGTALLLDGQRIFPLDPMPLHLNAISIPTDITHDDIERGSYSSLPKRMTYPLQYVHTVFRARKNGFVWVQFNVTGLPFGETTEPVPMGQKVVQILLRERHHREEVDNGKIESSTKLSIVDINIVDAKMRVQPPRMECGKLAMVQTTFDPNDWDDYGRLGTWSRTWNIFLEKLGQFWVEKLEDNALLLPLILLLAICVVMARRLYQLRQQESLCREDAETALLGRDDDDTSPPYADIPVIKIEEYD